MPDYIIQFIHGYGYIAIYLSMALGIFGLPIPDETILAFSGFLIYQKELNLIPTVLFSYMGSLTGISVSYYIGKKFGKKYFYSDHPFFIYAVISLAVLLLIIKIIRLICPTKQYL